MRQESYKVLAEHFADKAGLQVIFEAGACPSTDKERIILPSEVNENCVNPLLGALLHETAHVKHTENPSAVFNNMGEFARACVNALEDIRVDYLTSLKYPNSYDFIRELTKRVINTKSAQLQAEPLPVQVIKGLCVKSEGFAVNEVYTNPKTLELVEKCTPYIAEAKACSDTWRVVDVARRLLIDLIGNEAARPDLEKAARQAGKAYEKMREVNKEYEEAGAELQRAGAKIDAEYKQIRRQYNAQRKLEREGYCAEQEGRAADAKELKERAEGKKNVVETMKKHYEEARTAYDKDYQKRSELAQDFSKLEDVLSKAEERLKTGLELQGMNYGSGLSIGGFSALTKEDLAPDTSAKLETKTIDEIIADALLQRKDELVIDEQGSRLNAEALADYQTSPDKLFTVKEPRHDLTKVAFVLDVSGSMGDFGDFQRLGLAFKALDVLLRSVKGCIEQGAPCDVTLYAFGTDCERVFEGLEHYETEKTRALINEKRNSVGGSTHLLNAVNKVSADLLAEADKRAMILITDAQVQNQDCIEIINQTSGDCKQIFIAVSADLSGAAAQLFGKNNITDQQSALEVIGQALYRAI